MDIEEELKNIKPENMIKFLNELNTAILNPDTPGVGDFIALDWDGAHPSDFCKGEYAISWYCSKVIEVVSPTEYKVEYDDGARVYKFNEFGWPKKSKHGDWLIYPALSPIK